MRGKIRHSAVPATRHESETSATANATCSSYSTRSATLATREALQFPSRARSKRCQSSRTQQNRGCSRSQESAYASRTRRVVEPEYSLTPATAEYPTADEGSGRKWGLRIRKTELQNSRRHRSDREEQISETIERARRVEKCDGDKEAKSGDLKPDTDFVASDYCYTRAHLVQLHACRLAQSLSMNLRE